MKRIRPIQQPGRKKNKRRWRAITDFPGAALDAKRKELCDKCDGQNVKSFVADHWTFEYDLAHAGLGEEVYIAAKLAIKDGSNVPAAETWAQVCENAKRGAGELLGASDSLDVRAAKVYSEFTTGTPASKSMAAQHLACLLNDTYREKPKLLADKLPAYLKSAIEHVPGGSLVFDMPDKKTDEGKSSGEAK